MCDYERSQFSTISCCGAAYCQECWGEYLESQVVDQGLAYIACPSGECDKLLDELTVTKLIKEPVVLSKYVNTARFLPLLLFSLSPPRARSPSAVQSDTRPDTRPPETSGTSCHALNAAPLPLLAPSCSSQYLCRYQSAIARVFVTGNKKVKFCPAANCDNAIKVNTVSATPVTCGCGHTFCFKCTYPPHEPVRCEMLVRWIKKCEGKAISTPPPAFNHAHPTRSR